MILMKQILFSLALLAAMLFTLSGCQLAAAGDSGQQLVGYYITAASITDRAGEDLSLIHI